MACDSKRINVELGEESRKRRAREIETALERLERYLSAGTVKVVVGPTGAVAFKGWNDRDEIMDACAFRRLTAKGSSALRMALARAEAMAGRKMDPRAVNAGVHSHDGGKTWGSH